MQMAALVRPGLTTVRQPVRELATTAARLLRPPLDQQDGDIVLDTEVVLRGSCGCPDSSGGSGSSGGSTSRSGSTGGED
jgi:LacI family transcriptional regulator